ncbi:MBL fold metallo-hydrolase [Plantactinospora sp. S1510]|uniref:MBL fold metallo-hydrolase n=1 Tax=Plantactinospora alkalitolerans TaxID=2789879 RepID=A0ABS0GMY6_9ACTN|nr:MBL fold metallo-hydrolase [Plantactinospora alkalitolerans]
MDTPGPRRLAGRVWIVPGDPDPENIRGSVAVVADDSGSVVVDAGQSPAHAREIQSAIRAAGLPPARWLVYTHHHWDHVWGACAWPDVEIVGHVSGQEILRREAARPWSHRYLRDEVRANPRLGPSFRARALAMQGWDDFTILPPGRTFTDELTLPTGVRLRHVGGAHAPDSTVALVPDSKVALLGDCFYPPPAHLRAPDDGPDLAMVRDLLSDDYEWYVDSHGEPTTLEQARRLVST